MKVIVLLAVVAFAAVAQALNDKEKAAIGKFYTECVASTNVDEALVKKLRAGEFTDNNDALKKYVHCMFGKLQFINSAGQLQGDVIKSKIPSDFDHDEALKIITECKETQGKDADNIAYEAYKCFLKKTTKLIEF